MAARVRDVVWGESARDALDEVIAYIAHGSPQAAVQVLDAALQAAASLSTLSERGRIVPELNNPAIRETFVFRYRLMYRMVYAYTKSEQGDLTPAQTRQLGRIVREEFK